MPTPGSETEFSLKTNNITCRNKMECVNRNTLKYFCQGKHRTGHCNMASVQVQCARSCSCPDDHYSQVLGKFASKDCIHTLNNYSTSTSTLIVINSNARSHFSSMLSKQLSGQRHVIVYGDSENTELSTQHGTIHLRVRHDSIDFTGLIALVDHFPHLYNIQRFDRIFYMHDTMMVHNKSAFREALSKHSQSRTCSLQMGQSMNIGMYSVQDLLNSNKTLRALRGKDHPTVAERARLKKKNLQGWEGILFAKLGAWARYSTCGCELSTGPTSRRIVTEGAFKGRMELRYDSWGLSKYQHNYRFVTEGAFKGRLELRYDSWGLSKYQHKYI